MTGKMCRPVLVLVAAGSHPEGSGFLFYDGARHKLTLQFRRLCVAPDFVLDPVKDAPRSGCSILG